MLNKEFGGTVMKKDIREDGQFNINVETSSALFRLVEVMFVKRSMCWTKSMDKVPFRSLCVFRRKQHLL